MRALLLAALLLSLAEAAAQCPVMDDGTSVGEYIGEMVGSRTLGMGRVNTERIVHALGAVIGGDLPESGARDFTDRCLGDDFTLGYALWRRDLLYLDDARAAFIRGMRGR